MFNNFHFINLIAFQGQQKQSEAKLGLTVTSLTDGHEWTD